MTDASSEEVVGEPQMHVGYLIRRAQHLHVAIWARVVSTEISSVQYSILVVLDQRGEASQRELCDEVGLDRSTVADLVRRMQRRDLVERRRSPEDARRNTVTLTAQGRSERERLRPLVDQVQRELAGSLSPADRSALEQGLSRLLAAHRA